MIIIAGDSWGCGEWPNIADRSLIDHTKLIGLGHYLADDGHKILNISVPSGSNFGSLHELTSVLRILELAGQIKEISHIFVFQTEWYRDFRINIPDYPGLIKLQSDTYHKPTGFNSEFILALLSRWQYQLSDLAQTYNLRIGLIGGCSDTMWIDRFEQEYPGLYIACQSVTNLCINNESKIDFPCYAAYMPPGFVEFIKKSLAVSDSDFELFLDQLDQYNNRRKIWGTAKEWFWPDGIHLNRVGHQKLYNFLLEKNLLPTQGR